MTRWNKSILGTAHVATGEMDLNVISRGVGMKRLLNTRETCTAVCLTKGKARPAELIRWCDDSSLAKFITPSSVFHFCLVAFWAARKK